MLKEIQINQLSKKYSKKSPFSLKRVHFCIKAGTTHGILGSNGAGKTTLIKTICDVIEPSIGEVLFLNKKNEVLPKKNVKSIIGYVPQDFAFYEDLTIWNNFLFFGTMYNLDKKSILNRYEELLPFLRLEQHADKKIKHFSGGMKRKVNLALGLLHNPEVIILDEPTVGIDIKSKTEILQHLINLNKEGKTILYTSHQMEEAQEFCSHVSLFNNGSLICTGTTQQVLKDNQMNDLESLLLTI
ncbi:MAG: ABC transporter ATP-binding protein [Flavobacteriia bacterium]|nr:ABC transporter ATP-binding protein [Flavobacteriia bacterium]